MMIKNRVKAVQARIDKFQQYRGQLDMIRGERLFLQHLNCLPQDKLSGYGKFKKRELLIDLGY